MASLSADYIVQVHSRDTKANLILDLQPGEFGYAEDSSQMVFRDYNNNFITFATSGLSTTLMTGSGTAGKIPKFIGGAILGNSLLSDDGGDIYIDAGTDAGLWFGASSASNAYGIGKLGTNLELRAGSSFAFLTVNDNGIPTFNNSTIFGSTVDIAGKLKFTDFGSAADGSIWRDNNSGLSLRSVSGALYDFALWSTSGSYMFRQPKGTQRIEFVYNGPTSFSGKVLVGTHTSVSDSKLQVTGDAYITGNINTLSNLAVGTNTLLNGALNVSGSVQTVGTISTTNASPILLYGEGNPNTTEKRFLSLDHAGSIARISVDKAGSGSYVGLSMYVGGNSVLDFTVGGLTYINTGAVIGGTLNTSGTIMIPDNTGLRSVITSPRSMITRSGTTLVVGDTDGWTEMQHGIQSGNYLWKIGSTPTTYLTLNSVGMILNGNLNVSGTTNLKGDVVLSASTANQVVYTSSLNVMKSSSSLSFDGLYLGVGGSAALSFVHINTTVDSSYSRLRITMPTSTSSLYSKGIFVESQGSDYSTNLVHLTKSAGSVNSANGRYLRIDDGTNIVFDVGITVGIGGSRHTEAGLWIGTSAFSGETGTYGLVSAPSFPTTNTSFGIAIDAQVRLANSTIMTNAYGMYIENPFKGTGATINDVYGLLIESQTAGGSNNFAIYTGSGLVRLGDRIFGSSSLNVSGDTRMGSKLYFGPGGGISENRSAVYTNGTDGLIIVGSSGTTTDIVVARGGGPSTGQSILDVPSGTSTVRFYGDILSMESSKNLVFTHSSPHIISAADFLHVLAGNGMTIETSTSEIVFKPSGTTALTIGSNSLTAAPRAFFNNNVFAISNLNVSGNYNTQGKIGIGLAVGTTNDLDIARSATLETLTARIYNAANTGSHARLLIQEGYSQSKVYTQFTNTNQSFSLGMDGSQSSMVMTSGPNLSGTTIFEASSSSFYPKVNFRLPQLASAPGSPANGSMYFDTGSGHIMAYTTGTGWVELV